MNELFTYINSNSGNITPLEYGLLHRQQAALNAYIGVLNERIEFIALKEGLI